MKKVLHIYDMSVRIPMKDGENPEDIKDRLIEALDSVGENTVMSYKTETEYYDSEE